MVKRIDKLTDAQRAQFDAHADKWIEIGLRTGKADRKRFEENAIKCYGFAGLPPPKRIVWVDSPLVMALAAPIASYIIGKGVEVDVAVNVAVRDAVRDAVVGAVGDAVDVAVRGAVGGAVRGAVGGAVRDAVGVAVDVAVRGAVGGAVGDAVGVAVGDAVDDAVGNSVNGAADVAVGDAVVGAVGVAVDVAVDVAVGDAVVGAVDDAGKSIKSNWFRYIGGQFWVGGYWYGPALNSFFRDVCGLELDLWDRAIAYEETAKSACWWWSHSDFIMVCEHPQQINLELHNPNVKRGWNSHQLHNDKGPSIAWNGFELFHIHGVRVTEQIVMHPETITKHQIDSESNSEVKRIMLSRYGYERYLRESDAILVDECPADHPMKGLRTAKLYRMDEDVVVIDLLNSTEEPDGTTKRYVLSVDGERYDGEAGKNCHAAAASTWRVKGNETELLFKDYREYAPAFES